MIGDVVLQHVVKLILHPTASDVYYFHRVVLPRTVDAGVSLKICLYASDRGIPNNSVSSSKR